jgi:hypothetical protein
MGLLFERAQPDSGRLFGSPGERGPELRAYGGKSLNRSFLAPIGPRGCHFFAPNLMPRTLRER